MKEPRLRPFRVDLHVHSVLSPCGELEIRSGGHRRPGPGDRPGRSGPHGPQRLRQRPGYPSVRLRRGPDVFPGAEVQTEEDIHVVALFRGIRRPWTFRGGSGTGSRVPQRPGGLRLQLVVDARRGQILDQVDPLLVQGVAAGWTRCSGRSGTGGDLHPGRWSALLLLHLRAGPRASGRRSRRHRTLLAGGGGRSGALAGPAAPSALPAFLRRPSSGGHEGGSDLPAAPGVPSVSTN